MFTISTEVVREYDDELKEVPLHRIRQLSDFLPVPVYNILKHI